jgi:hypothetical protein
MKEGYVKFETAKLLKEKGFDWDTDKVYERSLMACRYEDYPMPTQQMACKWLREEKGIHPELELCTDNEFSFTIYKLDGKRTVLYEESRCWAKPEDAVEASLQYCLNNLIESNDSRN